ncbi:hypothetical protein [Syntrophomonas wolfei]|uniref:Uncharacterized protein n=1 Tax=Syntrophomonas wolfei subsp. wolfei (strain DSM 2245B / Goettingen) TaxID=335541 RepID=Q0AX50_SYNWW|nr:hypothetical protein [Syntrophomonas wolfei]ABI68704.1 hypothetical protein Swol_1397 [Syntrophomonas wolfei subsp. wolfei str. Goettingen G311]
MKRFVEKVEKFLIRAIILAVLIIVVVQGAMTQDSWRFYLSLGERMEGQTIEFPVNNFPADSPKNSANPNSQALESPRAEITLQVEKFSSLPHAIIMVNGEERAKFTNGEVALELNAGDVVEIDTSYYNFPLSFIVKDCSSNLAYPEKGKTFTSNQSIAMIGKIIVK